jgi:hypothetical protein
MVAEKHDELVPVPKSPVKEGMGMVTSQLTSDERRMSNSGPASSAPPQASEGAVSNRFRHDD